MPFASALTAKTSFALDATGWRSQYPVHTRERLLLQHQCHCSSSPTRQRLSKCQVQNYFLLGQARVGLSLSTFAAGYTMCAGAETRSTGTRRSLLRGRGAHPATACASPSPSSYSSSSSSFDWMAHYTQRLASIERWVTYWTCIGGYKRRGWRGPGRDQRAPRRLFRTGGSSSIAHRARDSTYVGYAPTPLWIPVERWRVASPTTHLLHCIQ
jgi:hypothetical protein